MAPSRPSLSISLPRNFSFPNNQQNGLIPKTPEARAEEVPIVREPPPPPRQKFTIKRRRAEVKPLVEPLSLPDAEAIIPTIEMSSEACEMSSPIIPAVPLHGLLSPLPTFPRLATPKTPLAHPSSSSRQDENPMHEWALINDSRDIQQSSFRRPSSVCSSFSDSSLSSDASSGYSAPYGSCTSPESVASDPFMEDDAAKIDKHLSSPDASDDTPQKKRQKRRRDIKWTTEMDQHLESTYIRYLSDPRVTPFKTLPGTAPPLGVCRRVAYQARHTWSQCRALTPSSMDPILESAEATSGRGGSPDTIRPETYSKESRQPTQWPRSLPATRKRLRKLVKAKPRLSAHYQRLLRTRSPSPFTSSTMMGRSSESLTSAFSSRDMNISLATSTAPSMQPEAPLAQLANEPPVDEEHAPRPQSQRSSRPADWFARIGRSQAHQKSLSLQSGLSLETSDLAASSPSPFDHPPNRDHLLQSMVATKSLGRQFTSNGKAPALDSPFELKAPTFPRSLKRRFKSNEDKPHRPLLEDVFGPPRRDEDAPIRNRGFTVGSARPNRGLSSMFEPPIAASPPTFSHTSPDHEMTEASTPTDLSHLGPIGSRSAPRRLAEPVPRLGSPFMEASGSGRPFNTFPRSYLATESNPQPFQQRLRELAARDVMK